MKRLAGFISAAALAVAAVACGETDAGITTAVKTKLAANDTVKAYRIDVDTNNHVVTLSGDVQSSEAKAEAVRVARATDGVRDVIDQLVVTDAAATSGIEFDVDTNIDDKAAAAARDAGNAIERGAEKTGDALKEGAAKAGTAIKNAGEKAKDAVTDDDRDSDKDGR